MPNDGVLDGVHLQRFAWNADLGALIFPGLNPGSDCAGLGRISRTVEGDASTGFSVGSLYGCMVFTHEAGHNLGSAHGNPDEPTPYWLSYARGHRVPGVASDIMIYECPPPNLCPHKPQFADPDDDFLGTTTRSGTASRDADRAISEISWAVSSYFPNTSNDHLWTHTTSRSHLSTNVRASTGDDPGAPYRAIVGNFRGGDARDEMFMYFPDTGADYLMNFGVSSGTFDKTYMPVNGKYRPVVGNFDGDASGFDDLFWYAPGTASDVMWWGTWSIPDFGPGNQSTIDADLVAWPVAGDFDGNGADDILWYSPTGSDLVWWGRVGATFDPVTTAVSLPSGVEPVSGDFDGDGFDDLLVYSPSGGDSVWWGSGGRSSFGTVGSTSTRVIGPGFDVGSGDFDGDGRDDLILYQPGAGVDAYWWGSSVRSSFDAATATATTVNGTYHSPLVGDFNFDSIDDLYWFAYG